MNIASNRKAAHEYLINEKFVAGIVLLGWEIKSLRANGAQIQEAYVAVRGGEAFLEGASITPVLGMSKFESSEPTRKRKLLLHRTEIASISKGLAQGGFTAIPIDLFFSEGRVKCTLALAKGKKLHDKRQSSKDADLKREVGFAMKSARS